MSSGVEHGAGGQGVDEVRRLDHQVDAAGDVDRLVDAGDQEAGGEGAAAAAGSGG